MEKQANDPGRRQLLKALALGSAAGAVATVVSSQVVAAPADSPTQEQGETYRETQHVRDFYASLRS